MTDVITLGSVLSCVLTIVATVIGFVVTSRKIRRENDADAKLRAEEVKTEFRTCTDGLGVRVKDMETLVRDFVPRREIEAKFEHEKVNRVTGQEALTEALREQGRTLGEVQREQARFGAQLEGATGAIAKVEGSIEKLSGSVTDRLDRIAASIAAMARPVP